MFKNTIVSFGLAIQNIRSNLFHTLLSVLGIVIGVAALVAILSFIDGLEKFAKDQITQTTSLNAVVIHSVPYRQVGAVRVKKDSFALLDYGAYTRLTGGLANVSRTAMIAHFPAELHVDQVPAPVGAMVQAVSGPMSQAMKRIDGKLLDEADVDQRRPVAVVNTDFVQAALGTGGRMDALLGRTVRFGDRVLTIEGIVQSNNRQPAPQVMLPVSLLAPAELRQSPPECFLEATSVEWVAGLKKQVEDRLKTIYQEKTGDFEVFTNEFRVSQATRGIGLFRIIMGLIVGISILVGGIGVMNVLLIAVNERTTEIGIRKAVGASRRDILRQFLAESIAVSAFGSGMGLLVGVLGTLVIVPVVSAVTGLPFQAIYTWNTFFVISVVAVLVGIVFGTYPAIKAARLDPVEAIRRE